MFTQLGVTRQSALGEGGSASPGPQSGRLARGHGNKELVADLGGMCPPSLLASPHQPPLSSLDTQRLFSHEGSRFQMFSSEAYGQKDLLFKDATSELVPIATQSYEAWLGREYLQAMKGLLCDPNRKSTGLLPHWLQPSRTTGMAMLSGEAAGRGHSPQELCPLASMRTDCFHLPASGGLGRKLLQSCMACCILGLSWEGSPCPSTQKSSSPIILSPQCLSLPPPHPIAKALVQPLSVGWTIAVVYKWASCFLPPTAREMVCHSLRHMAAMICLKPPHSPMKEAHSYPPFCKRKQDQIFKYLTSYS